MKRFLTLLFLLIAAPAWAGVFFIDNSPTGCAGAPCSNANTGTSPATAFLDTSKITGQTFSPGDQYLLKSGDTFRYPTENATDMMVVNTYNNSTVGNSVIFGSYGQGAKPVINGAHCHGAATGVCTGSTPVTWTLDSASIYKITYNTAYVINIVVDGPQGDNLAPANTTAGSGYGLALAGCKTGTCGPGAGFSSVAPAWATGQTYAVNQCTSNATQGNGQIMCVTVHTANSGGSAPSCAAGGTCAAGTTTNVTQNDTGNTWAYYGNSAFAQGAMTAGTWYTDGQNVYIWMPDSSNPSTHSIEFVTHDHGFRSNSNNNEKNNITVQGLHFTRLGEGLRFFSNGAGGTTNCQGGHIIANNIIDQIGTGNADDGQFWTAVRYSQANATNCIVGNLQPRPEVIGNRIDHMSGRGLTMQAAAGGIEAENEGTFCPHSCMNDVSVAATANNALTTYHNKIHDIHHSLTYASSFPDTAVAVYDESSNNLNVALNIIYDVTDANCGTAQCDCIQLFANTSTAIINNTCNNVQNGIYVTSASANVLIENNLIANLAGGVAGTSQLPMNLNNTCCAAPGGVDFNLLTNATTVGNYNSLTQTFAQWNASGFDSNGTNTNATFMAVAYPFQQTTSSTGYLTGDRNKGYGRNIGANQYGALP